MTVELYATKVFPKPGAMEFLREMKRRGILLGIATSNDREIAEAALNARGLGVYFDSVRTSCEVEAGKPAPDVYLETARGLGISPADCLVFEDVPMGILAGKRAGMKVCAVEDDFSKGQEKQKRELADWYIQDYYEVLRECL